MANRANAHELARDPAFRPPRAWGQAADIAWGQSPNVIRGPVSDVTRGPGLPATEQSFACRRCGSEQVIPIPIWNLTVESDEETGMLSVPVALVCLDCHNQAVYQAVWRAEEETDG